MRRALTVLTVVAVVVLIAGVVNRDATVDLSYIAGTQAGVSLLWVGAGAAALVLVAGLIAALLARASAARDQGRLEAELEEIYRRLRAAEARLPQSPEAAVTTVMEAQAAPTAVTETPGADAPTVVMGSATGTSVTAVGGAAADVEPPEPPAPATAAGIEPRESLAEPGAESQDV